MVKVPPGVVVLRLVALNVGTLCSVGVADDSGCIDGVVIPLCWCGKVYRWVMYIDPGVGVANISGCIDGVHVSFCWCG